MKPAKNMEKYWRTTRSQKSRRKLIKAVARKNKYTKTEKQPFSGLALTTKGQPFFKLSTQIVNPNIPIPEKILRVSPHCVHGVLL